MVRRAGSADAEIELVRILVADGEYQGAQFRLGELARNRPELPPERLVGVAPDVLGPRVRLAEDDFDDRARPVFTVISPDRDRAAAALARIDTKGMMWSAMGRTMVRLIADALADDGVPAHIAGYRPDLDSAWRAWAAAGT